MSVKRTPDVFFENLTDWPHPPQYLTDLPSVEGLRVHYIDTGEAGISMSARSAHMVLSIP